ncbi:ribonuclease HIII [Thermocrinis albus DSM 14484]|uniref:Ribonuclease n=1 Tax=Thermocrinis albus (strain DSM 14484 / JCM 11386 / HI 11/12) TaxID=638303 RepID=D3SNR8_THEAH|nr:ribonuclease HIII [Thermocrinis albus]ADC88805.1 ribonuclease HIII [Thermocrinis albus DSM 14484]
MNLTLKIPEELSEDLLSYLRGFGLKEAWVRGAVWSLQGEGVKVSYFPSGVVLIQGKGAERIRDLLLEKLGGLEGPVVGCDESGKGDVFGPLVVCCAVVKPENYLKLVQVAPRDGKSLTPQQIAKKFSLMQDLVDIRCRIMPPEELNALYKDMPNMNRVLTYLYKELLKEVPCQYPIVVDAYASRNPFGPKVTFVPKGEKNIAVACASIAARYHFLQWLQREGLPAGSSAKAMQEAHRILREDPERARRTIKLFFLQKE